jgi:hypothetical protein
LIFNHRTTSLQEEDARRSLGVARITDLPEELKAMWRQIPADLEKIDSYLAPIKSWLKGQIKKGDYVLVQGDFGACFIMVNFALEQGWIPIYSTTERKALEEQGPDGTVKITHQFRHRIYRRYGE